MAVMDEVKDNLHRYRSSSPVRGDHKRYQDNLAKVFGEDHKCEGTEGAKIPTPITPCFTPGPNALKGDISAYQDGYDKIFSKK